MSGEDRENENKTSNFRITSYDEGYYEPNGNKIEVPFSEHGLKDWDLMAGGSDKQGRVFGVGQKLTLPSSPVDGYKISFGRQLPKVDVEVDMDIVGELCANELAVSRQHFQIANIGGKWEVEDLGSTNGINCHRANVDKSEFQNLKYVERPWELKDGDTLFIGGGPGVAGRIIGFRFYAPKDEQPYLVKFNAVSLDEMLSASGTYKLRPELLEEAQENSRDATESVRSELIKAGSRLVEAQQRLFELKDSDRTRYLVEGMAYEQDFLKAASDLAEKYYSGDWPLAMSELGQWAFQSGETMLRKNEEKEKNVDTSRVRAYLLVADKAMGFSSKYIS